MHIERGFSAGLRCVGGESGAGDPGIPTFFREGSGRF